MSEASTLPRVPGAFAGLDDADVARLGAGEALVLDDVLGRETALALAAWLTRREPELTTAAIGRGEGLVVEPALRGDRTLWLERPGERPLAAGDEPLESPGPPEPPEAYGALWALFDRLAGDLRERAFLGVQDVEVQLALYPGDGARYVAHRDAFASGGRRRATAVYYLNPDWRAEHGGALRVVGPDGVTRDVAPLCDRLVVYLAHLVEHEVLPTFAPRWAVTAWMLGPLAIG